MTAVALSLACGLYAADAATLKICADPSNLPYSDDHEAGFENRVARLLAQDMHATLQYTWSMERRGFLRKTLLSGACDAVISVPEQLGVVATTRPWFTSTYVMVTPRARGPGVSSFDDPTLRSLRIGVQLVGAEGANTPPTLSLARRGIVAHVTGFPMWDGADVATPQARIIDAVASGQIDVAIVWGPFAGYFAKPYGDRLTLTPLGPDKLLPGVRFAYGMSIGVRPGDDALRAALQQALDRRAADIRAILADYAVPVVAPHR